MPEKIKRILFFLIFFLVFAQYNFAQQDTASKPDMAYYFNDKITSSTNIIKICPTTLLQGDLPFFWERILGNVFSFELGLGYQLPYYVNALLFNDIQEAVPVASPVHGFSLWVFPRFYIFRTAPEFGFVGLQMRKRFYYHDDEKIVESAYTFTPGIQLFLFRNKRICLEYDAGIGFLVRIRTSPLSEIKKYYGGSYQINIIAGYKF